MRNITKNLDKKAFMELYNQGLFDSEVAQVLGVKRKIIERFRRSLGLQSNFKKKQQVNINIVEESLKQGLTDLQTTKVSGLSIQEVFNIRKSLGFKSTTEVEQSNLLYKDINMSILYGCILGDGWLTNSSKSSAKGGFGNKKSNRDYVEFKKSLLSNVCLDIKERKIQIGNAFIMKREIHSQEPLCMVNFKSSPFLKEIFNKLYINGKKRLTPEIVKDFGEETIALYFFDDGSKIRYKGKNAYSYKIAMYDFTDECKRNLQKFLLDKFQIESTIPQGCIYIRANSRDKFKAIISKYAVPSMEYKL